MEKTIELLGVGSPIIDTLAHVDDAFIEGIDGDKGGMVLVSAEGIQGLIGQLPGNSVQVPGGSAGNTAFTAARLGVKTSFLGKIGNDDGGAYYRSAFEAMGGDGSRFVVGDVANGRCLSLITPDSSRTMRTDLGAAMTLRPDEIGVEMFRGVRHAHIEGYLLFNRDLMMAVLNGARDAGCTISLDLASFEVVEASKDYLPEILKTYVTVVFGNEDECRQLFGVEVPFEAMAKQLGDWCEVGVVKLGAEGSLISDGDELIRVDPIRGVQAIDTTGAGDLWASGFLYGWLRGRNLADCGRFGSVLGAEIVQVVGATIPDERWASVVDRLK